MAIATHDAAGCERACGRKTHGRQLDKVPDKRIGRGCAIAGIERRRRKILVFE